MRVQREREKKELFMVPPPQRGGALQTYGVEKGTGRASREWIGLQTLCWLRDMKGSVCVLWGVTREMGGLWNGEPPPHQKDV